MPSYKLLPVLHMVKCVQLQEASSPPKEGLLRHFMNSTNPKFTSTVLKRKKNRKKKPADLQPKLGYRSLVPWGRFKGHTWEWVLQHHPKYLRNIYKSKE